MDTKLCLKTHPFNTMKLYLDQSTYIQTMFSLFNMGSILRRMNIIKCIICSIYETKINFMMHNYVYHGNSLFTCTNSPGENSLNCLFLIKLYILYRYIGSVFPQYAITGRFNLHKLTSNNTCMFINWWLKLSLNVFPDNSPVVFYQLLLRKKY